MINFSIDNQSLIITDNGVIVGDYPKKDVYYIVGELDNGFIALYDTNGTNNGALLYKAAISNSNFADAAAFQSFAHSSLGFKTAAGGSAVFRANSTVTQTMGSFANGTTIEVENVIETEGFVYSNGLLLFQKGGFYSIDIQIHLDSTSGQNAEFESWLEYNVPASPSLPFPNSGRLFEFRERTEGVVTYSSHLKIEAGTSFALVGRSKLGAVDLLASTLTNGVAAPSVVVSVIKI